MLLKYEKKKKRNEAAFKSIKKSSIQKGKKKC